MTQDQWQLLGFRVVLVASVISVLAWMLDYTLLSAGWNWRNPIGRTFMYLKVLLLGLLFTATLSVFFGLNRYTSRLTGWVDLVFIGLIAPVMVTRIRLFRRLYRPGGIVTELVCRRCDFTMSGRFPAVEWWDCPSCEARNAAPIPLQSR